MTKGGLAYCNSVKSLSPQNLTENSRLYESPIKFSPSNVKFNDIPVKYSPNPDILANRQRISKESLKFKAQDVYEKSPTSSTNLFSKLDVNAATRAVYDLYNKYKLKTDLEQDYDDFIGSYIGKNRHDELLDEVSITNTSRYAKRELSPKPDKL